MKNRLASLGKFIIRAVAPALNRFNTWVQAQVTALPDPECPMQGCPAGLSQTCQEVALRLQSEGQNQAILSAIPDILTVISAEGIYLSVSYNRFSGTLIPLENMDIAGMHLSEVLPAAAAARTLAAVQRALATGVLQIHEQEIPFGDRIQYEEVRIVPYQADRVLCMVRDISDRKQAETALRQSEAKQRALIRALPDLIMQVTRDGVYLDFYTTAQFSVLGDRDDLVGTRIDETLPPALAQKRMAAIEAALETGELQVYEQDLWINGRLQTEECRVVVCSEDEVLVIGRDVTDRNRAVAQLESQNVLLARIAKGEPLTDMLHDLIRQVEQSFSDAACSIFLVNEENCLQCAAVHRLPETFVQQVGDIPIAEGQGSCGTAAFRKQTVIVTDVATDSLWASIKPLLLSYGLRACWSTPIIASDGRVLGVLGVYYREGRSPHPHELDAIAQIANLAGIAIEREQAETALRQSEAKNRAILAAIPDLLLRVKRDGTCLDYIPPEIATVEPSFIPIQSNISEVLPPDLFQYQLARMEQAASTGELQVWEHQLCRFGVLCSEEVRLVHCEGDEFLLVVRDITDRELTQAALKASEERYRQIVETQTDLVTRSTPDTTITFANLAFCRALGRSPEEAVGMQWIDTIPPDELEAIHQKIANLSSEHPTFENINANYRANGEVRWTQWVNLGIFNDQGKLVEIQSVGRDITERKKAEADLRTQRNLLRAFLDNLPHMAWLKDTEGRFMMVNAVLGEACNLPPGEVVGKTDADLFPPELAQSYRNDDLMVIQSRQRKRVEEPLITADGSFHWIDTIKTPIYDAQDEILGVAGIAIDLTERRRAELALRESEARYRRIVETANEGIWIIDTDSQTSFVNPKMAEMLGYGADEMLGRSLFDFMDDEGRAIALQHLENRRQGLYEQHDLKFQHKDGHDVWTIISTNPIHDDGGQYIGALGMITDISDRKHIELTLKYTNELLSAISKAQTQFITDADPEALFENLLETLLQLTNSEYGFIGEILYNGDGQAYVDESYMKVRGKPYLKTKAITNVAWNQETQRLYEESASSGMEFHNLNTLFGQVMVTGQPVISNYPSADPRRGGLPHGHPPLNAFLGIPFYRGDQLVGMVGIANRPDGYDEAVITALDPFLTTCATTIEAYRNDTRRKQAETALAISQERMQTLINGLPFGVWVRDADDRVVLQNSIDMARYGNLLGTTLHDLPTPLERKLQYYRIKEQYNVGEFYTYETVESLNDSHYFFLRISAPLRDTDGRKGMFGVAIDITDRKHTELALQQLNEELEQRVEQRTQELIRSEQDLRTIFNNVYDAILIHDLEGTILDANDRALELRQATREQLLGATLLDLSAPDAPIGQLPDILQRVQAGETMRFEWRERRFSDQRPFDVEVSLRKVTLSNRPVILAGVRDISDRKQAEQDLQESRNMLELVLDTIPQRVFWKDRESRFLGCNRAFAQDYHLSPDEIIGKTDLELPWAAWAHLYREDDANVIQTRTSKLNYEEPTHNCDGAQIWIRTSKIPLTNSQGDVLGVLGCYDDITARKRVEEALRDNEERLRLALTAANQGLYDLNLQTGEAIVSPEYATMLGYDPATFQETNGYWIERLHPHDRERVAGIYQAYVTGQMADYQVEFRQRTQDGQWKWILSLGKIVAWDEAGHPLRMLGTHTDIDDRKRLEQELRQINLELEQRVEERTLDLQRAIEAAEAANRAKSVFLANMSHELRTPLNAILGFAQLMTRDRTLDSEKRQQLCIINRSGEHLLYLINDILEMSKIEAGRTSYTSISFDLQSLLNTVEELFQLRAREKGLQFRVERVATLPTYIETDENKLRQVLINLIGNAIKFTQSGYVILRVQVEASNLASDLDLGFEMGLYPPSPVTLWFELEDTGPGIDPAELDLLFEPFTQSRNRQVSQEGTGLGLPISRQFVRLMGGDLTVESRLGSGSLFKFSIQAQLAESSPLSPAPVPRPIVGLASNQPDYRMLVVEDHETNRQLLVQLLQAVGFGVRTATNGQEAIALWEHWQPHLIWMDMRMPIMNGYEATKQIRLREAQQALTSTVIIALTASAFEEDRARVLDEGCDDFVRKPFQESQLLEKIAEHLGVEYRYADPAPPPSQSPAQALSVDAIATLQTLPPALLAQLYQATIQLDSQQLYRLIEQVASDHPVLASILTEKVDNFDLDHLLALLQDAMD